MTFKQKLEDTNEWTRQILGESITEGTDSPARAKALRWECAWCTLGSQETAWARGKGTVKGQIREALSHRKNSVYSVWSGIHWQTLRLMISSLYFFKSSLWLLGGEKTVLGERKGKQKPGGRLLQQFRWGPSEASLLGKFVWQQRCISALECQTTETGVLSLQLAQVSYNWKAFGLLQALLITKSANYYLGFGQLPMGSCAGFMILFLGNKFNPSRQAPFGPNSNILSSLGSGMFFLLLERDLHPHLCLAHLA